MIRAIEIRNFKKFGYLRCELPDRAVIAGPNNVGKTTLLQAISTWFLVAKHWRERQVGLARDRAGGYAAVAVDLPDFGAVPLAGVSELWTNQAVDNPVSIRLETEKWNIRFEIYYEKQDKVRVHPAHDVMERDMERYLNHPPESLYISSLSGLDLQESEYGLNVVSTRLARGLGGAVIRTLIRAIYKEEERWNELGESVRKFFPGFELSAPSGDDPIRARYRHSSGGPWYDLVSSGAGLLQILMINAALLYKKSTILLIDELDVHLYALLKGKMYEHMRSYAIEHECQVLIATHSSQIIKAAARHGRDELQIVTANGLRKIAPQQVPVLEGMMSLEPMDILHAVTTGYVLYLEAESDFEILRLWAGILDHEALSRLDSPFCVFTAQKEGRNFSREHFRSLQLHTTEIRGVEIRDRNMNTEHQMKDAKSKMPPEMTLMYWGRYEIENYLVHPAAIGRLFEAEYGGAEAKKAEAHMRKHLPEVRFSDPFVEIHADRIKGKDIIEQIVDAVGVGPGRSGYYRIAKYMRKDEIHPDVRGMLDAIAEHLPERP